jgi:hypothetical protein
LGKSDIFGFLMFLVFLGVSFAGKMIKNKQQGQETGREPRRQQWPGPTAPPGIPGYPRPATPSLPRQSRAPQPSVPMQQSRPPQPSVPLRDVDDDDEGVGTEGPGAGETVQAELARFDQETSRLAKRDLAAYQPRLPQYQPHFSRLQTALHTQEAEPVAVVADVVTGLDDALADPQAVARAFVLAEVLGKPRAMRRRGW